ncbi:WW domain-binding protein 11-like isoform X2 [Dreissena polymorpha]|uniref:WW domain-binding protein 11-like isoform X2 n=1 Tax=Dreissena polymorpha TaxID=45954 RepID=UPI002263C4E7|nr:WW domain-binding protein 11-like isoform X2 [Dreissena polymorpha]
MGRRSINTTKSGKYMNPTDQARKEARKRELKKNKKQRMMVRTAVLKGKDPLKLLEEMEFIDQMEFNPMEAPKLNEKVLKDKRKKLHETFMRVFRLYEKENPDYAKELFKANTDYEKKRERLQVHYEQVKVAERVQLNEIPLPDMPAESELSAFPIPGDIPLPQKGILKKISAYSDSLLVSPVLQKKKKAPGPPPGPPPDLSDSEPEEDVYNPADGVHDLLGTVPTDEPPDVEEGMEVSQSAEKRKKIRFIDDDSIDPAEDEKDTRVRFKPQKPKVTSLQKKMLQMAGQQVPEEVGDEDKDSSSSSSSDSDDDDDSEFRRMRERSRKNIDRDSDSSSESEEEETFASHRDNDDDDDVDEEDRNEQEVVPPTRVQPPPSAPPKIPSLLKLPIPPGPPPGAPSGLPPGMPPGPPPGVPPMMMRPPPLGGPPRAPPGAPPRMMRPGPPLGRPQGMPPGPPPGLPPNIRMPPRLPPPGGPPAIPPPRIMRPPTGPPTMPASLPPPPGIPLPPSQANPNVLSAPPSIMKLPQKIPGEQKKDSATISAKPQIKNPVGDVTRFMPTSLKVKRSAKDTKVKKAGKEEELLAVAPKPAPAAQQPGRKKDDAYDQFMREMENLL